MKYCSRCGAELFDETIFCPNCGFSVEGFAPTRPAKEDTVNVWLCILSAIIPLFGFIYWAVAYRETPRKARACGITAIVAVAVSIFLRAMAWILVAALIGSIL